MSAIIFKSNTTKRKPIHKALLALDIENSPKTGKFINAALYGYIQNHHGKERKVDKFFDKQEVLLDYLNKLKKPEDKNIPCKLIFFNLAYDIWFLSKISDDSAMLSSGTRIITGKLNNGIPMLDLANHVDGTLEDWIGYLDMENKFGIKKESLTDLRKRVESDARATYELGHFIEDFYVHELKIPFKLTVASAARYLYALHYFDGYWYREEKNTWINQYEREGYRGGRCEVFKRGNRHVFSFDENSEYLSVMYDKKLPDPNTAKYYNNKNNDTGLAKIIAKDSPDTLFIADVTLEVPEQRIPPLPFKKDKESPVSKLIFPVGTITGKYYSPELIYAVKNCGVKIIKVHSYVTYHSKPYFRDYADFIWNKRKEYKDKHNRGMDLLIKKLGNALYGGFGQRNPEWTYFGKLKDFEGAIGENSDVNIIKINGVDYIACGDSKKNDSSHTFPCIPGFITSYARVDLLDGLKANENIAVYGDTDSTHFECDKISDIKNIKIGDGLGEWGLEYEKTQIYLKPKMYGDKIKGVPKRAELVYTEKENEMRGYPDIITYVFRKPNRMKESFKRGLMPDKWEYVIKEVNVLDDKRVWDKDGLESVPIRVV